MTRDDLLRLLREDADVQRAVVTLIMREMRRPYRAITPEMRADVDAYSRTKMGDPPKVTG